MALLGSLSGIHVFDMGMLNILLFSFINILSDIYPKYIDKRGRVRIRVRVRVWISLKGRVARGLGRGSE